MPVATGFVLTNLIALLAVLGAFVGYELGGLAPSNAFFLAVSGVALYTGSQFALRDGMPIGAALRSLVAEPASYPLKRIGQISYLAATGLGLAMVTQVVATA